MTTLCSYYNPLNASGTTPLSDDAFAFASSTCASVPYDMQGASSTVGIINGMTFDGIISSVWLFMMTAILFYGVIMKTKRPLR